MKEVGNYAPSIDNVMVSSEKFNNSMGNIAADIWQNNNTGLDSKKIPNGQTTKCFGLNDLQIEGQETKTKGGCTTSSLETDALPGKLSSQEAYVKPFAKPEKPADGGLKDPLKDPIKVPSLEGGIKKPFKPNSGDTIEFGEPFVKPVPKPGKVIKSTVGESKTLE